MRFSTLVRALHRWVPTFNKTNKLPSCFVYDEYADWCRELALVRGEEWDG